MADFKITIDSVVGGISPGFYHGKDDQFHASIAIDPYHVIGGNLPKRNPGILVPTGYTIFSGTEIDNVTYSRVYTIPNTSIDTRIDPDSPSEFREKVKGTVGDVWDQSAEASEKRAKKH